MLVQVASWDAAGLCPVFDTSPWAHLCGPPVLLRELDAFGVLGAALLWKLDKLVLPTSLINDDT
jgi:hypothetical protein